MSYNRFLEKFVFFSISSLLILIIFFGLISCKRNQSKTHQPTTVNLIALDVLPSRIKQGKSLKIILTYQLLSNKKQKIKITQSLYYKKKFLKRITKKTFKRSTGKWEDTFSVNIPMKATPGKYVIDSIIESGNSIDKSYVIFEVIT